MSTGALIGGFLGYFVAQVNQSDWESSAGAERPQMRSQYAVSGAAVGALAGYFLRPRKLHVGRKLAPTVIPPRAGRQLLASTDLGRSLATNAFEAVELERPEWLRSLPMPLEVAASDTAYVQSHSLVVYLGAERVGGVTSLRDVSLAEVGELRLYDAREAEQKWGLEHKYGAIEVVPPGTSSPGTTGSSASPSASPPQADRDAGRARTLESLNSWRAPLRR